MKKIIIGLFICTFSATIFSQNLVKEGRKWTVLSFDCLTTEYLIRGDTIIESITYKKLLEKKKNELQYKLIGVLREENGRIYQRTSWWDGLKNEGLLYDFNVKEGEEVKIDNYLIGYPYETGRPIYVDRIEYKNTNRGVIKKITLSRTVRSDQFRYSFSIWDCWYDNVGCIKGIISSGGYCCSIVGTVPRLVSCIDSDGAILFQNNESDECDDYTSTPSIQDTPEKVKVSCDTSSDIKVSLDSSAGSCSFELFNTQGSLVMERQVSPGLNRLNTNKKGFFFYRIHDSKNVLKTGKLLIK